MVRVSSAYNHAIKEGWHFRNPVVVPAASWIQPITAKEIPTIAEVQRLAALVEVGGAKHKAYSVSRGKYVKDVFTAQPSSVIADMMRLTDVTGLRIIELCGLIVGDVSMFDKSLHVTKQIHRDGKSESL